MTYRQATSCRGAGGLPPHALACDWQDDGTVDQTGPTYAVTPGVGNDSFDDVAAEPCSAATGAPANSPPVRGRRPPVRPDKPRTRYSLQPPARRPSCPLPCGHCCSLVSALRPAGDLH